MKKFYTVILAFSAMLLAIQTHAKAPSFILNKSCATHQIEQQYFLDNFDLSKIRTSPISARANEDGDTSYSVPIVNSDSTYTIQVVVHVVYLKDNIYENPSDEAIQSQIDALNRDFNLKNSIDHIRPEFLQFIGNPKIKFELASVDPKGNPTNGITRKKGSPRLAPDWTPLIDNVKHNNTGGTTPWAPNYYLNIWVCDLNIANRVSRDNVELDWDKGALGGYANPPKGLPNWIIDLLGVTQDGAATAPMKQGVVIDFRFFGQNNEFNKDYLNNSPYYGMGRTTVHEVGHYLGLRHTWGDYGPILDLPCDEIDDGIKDTPHEDNAYATFIEAGDDVCNMDINSCHAPYPGDGIDYPDMRENFMNYSTDLCYGMFTKEQVNMMRYALTTKRSNIIINSGIEDEVPTRINELKSLPVTLYPNPANDILNISFGEISAGKNQVQIYNALGALVLYKELGENTQLSTISIQDFAPGAYFLHIKNGSKGFSQQFMKQ